MRVIAGVRYRPEDALRIRPAAPTEPPEKPVDGTQADKTTARKGKTV